MGFQKYKKMILWGIVTVEAAATFTVYLIGNNTFGNHIEAKNYSVKSSQTTKKDKESVIDSKKENNIEPVVSKESKESDPGITQDKQNKAIETINLPNTTQQTADTKAVSKTKQKSTSSTKPTTQTVSAQEPATSTPSSPAAPTITPAPTQEPATTTPVPEPAAPSGEQTTPATDPATTPTPTPGETPPADNPPAP